MLRLGLLGCGAIGYRVAQAVADGTLPYQLSAVQECSDTARERLLDLHHGIFVAESLDELVRGCDVLVEAAAADVVPELIAAARAHGAPGFAGGHEGSGADAVVRTQAGASHIVVLSVGGLLDVEPANRGPVIHAPAGAIGGLEAVQALAVAGLDEVTLTTRKPPASLGLAVDSETLLFEGSAREAFARYPRNINVAATLSLAGIGADRTRVRLFADPQVSRNTHHVVARGPAGEIEFTSRNEPFPANPATSYLAALSAIALLQRLSSRLQVG